MTTMYHISETLGLPDSLNREGDKAIASLQAVLGDDDQQGLLQVTLLRELLAVSPFIAKQLTQQLPSQVDFLQQLQQPFDALALQARVDATFSQIADEANLMARLRQFRNQQIAVIAWRDLAGLAALDETLASLSALADALISVCLTWHSEALEQRHGAPKDDAGEAMPLVVLAMGKLGAAELNFSSDIDLILAYELDGETDIGVGGKKSISHQEFFQRLGQKLYKSLNEVTADGFVFRTDLRLRPYGESGPLVMSFAAMEDYYQTQGREWERYAMIKARSVGVGIAVGEQLLEILKPFVYRKYLDFGVIQSLRELKAMINREVIRKDRADNLKLGPGGIREIEFIAQVFQLMRGGQDSSLQCRAVQPILRCLSEKRLITAEDSTGLIAAYRFLRQAENHLQEIHDRQEHALPSNTLDQARLAFSMGFESYAAFTAVLQLQRDFVQRCFDAVFAASDTVEQNELVLLWRGDLQADELSRDLLQQKGFADAEALLKKLHNIKYKGVYPRLSRNGQERFDALIPELLALSAMQQDANADQIMQRLLSVVNAIARRESYLALLNEAPAAREQLARLCAESLWITQVISQHPVLLDELIDARRLYAPADRAQLNVELTCLLADIDEDDVEMQMERLRNFKQVQQLHIAAADIMAVMPLMVVSDHLSWLAESIVNVALELAWMHMQARYGEPCYREDGETRRAQFAVIAYGKLGGLELGYGSDLDLMFVHDSHGEAQNTNGERSVENSVFFTRLAQRFVHLLATLTPAGTLYEIDTRLRPNGQSGLLVTSLAALQEYQLNEAWTWEHQALVRARAVAGEQKIASGFEQLRRAVLSQSQDQFGDTEKLRSDVVEMRQRMRQELDRSNDELFDLKQGAGGIVDIEFMVQYLALRWASVEADFLAYTDVVRLLAVAGQTSKLPQETAKALTEAYRAYRRRVHHLVLQERSACVEKCEYEQHRQQVKAAWKALLALGD